jgi:hypothetical protein
MARRSKRADLGTEFTAEVYRAAAEQHWTSLQLLYDQEHYVLALYISGVAVECMFRAFRARINPEFDARHDLFAMARAARFASIVSSQQLRPYAAALSAVAVRWSNNHRYRSDSAIRKWLKRASLDRGIAGDYLKENARRAISAAGFVVSLGVAQWKT